MKECSTVRAQPTATLDCDSARGSVSPDNRLINDCCYNQDFYKECLSSCYLETGINDYKKCMYECLKKQEQKYNIPNIRYCLHLLNFYCCSLQQ